MSAIKTPQQDVSHQYSDGRDLLSAALIEREELLRELEVLAKEPQGKGGGDTIIRFDTIRAQTLIFDLSRLTERIDSLIVLINGYAQKCGKPRVEIVQGANGGRAKKHKPLSG